MAVAAMVGVTASVKVESSGKSCDGGGCGGNGGVAMSCADAPIRVLPCEVAQTRHAEGPSRQASLRWHRREAIVRGGCHRQAVVAPKEEVVEVVEVVALPASGAASLEDALLEAVLEAAMEEEGRAARVLKAVPEAVMEEEEGAASAAATVAMVEAVAPLVAMAPLVLVAPTVAARMAVA